MLIDEIIAKHVTIHGRGLPRAKDFLLSPFNCPKCGALICGNLAYYCRDECKFSDDRNDDWGSGVDCHNECCGDLDEIYDVFKVRYPEISDYAYKWWNKERERIIGSRYQEYPAVAYILKMTNILWCLDQKFHFTVNILEDGLFDI